MVNSLPLLHGEQRIIKVIEKRLIISKLLLPCDNRDMQLIRYGEKLRSVIESYKLYRLDN